MSKKEQKLRKEIRNIIKEEISPSLKKSLQEALEREIRKCMDDVLMRHNVEQKGLSEGQSSWLFRKLDDVIKEKLEEYETTRMPNDPDIKKAAEDYKNA